MSSLINICINKGTREDRLLIDWIGPPFPEYKARANMTDPPINMIAVNVAIARSVSV